MGKDLQRLRDYFQFPWSPPSVSVGVWVCSLKVEFLISQNVAEVMFNKGSLRAQRLLVATELSCPEKLEGLSRQLWLRIWSRVSGWVSEWVSGEKGSLLSR